ncbi:FAD binding domain-containing protein [Blastococcus mobilis]|uniref:CO or xanthine dehydrogenase, FAD-binding subunit n=1 Tax=Blastococcus mobilis TaxID=1938746 RepID=A0A238Y884_9ACTN|nr:FAD binding domain-containing protein [Blastococcus mobilis]SNR67496.1 CO or xanthine dehydrogenase, FAD-binding subunit [Blastococcus mobilis]
MDFLQPTSWTDALAARAERPDAVAIAGGTDVMVDLNFDRRRPGALLDLGRVPELREWAAEDGWVRLGAGVPYSRIIEELAIQLPGLAMASRTVGSPQIRIRATVGGNLGSASPAGDAHPPLLAAGAVVEVQSAARGARRIPAEEFYTGVKRNALAPDELIAAVLVPTAAGPQQFCKVGTRNAMVIAVSAFACALHPDRKTVGTGIGSAAPTPRRAPDAEDFLAGELQAAGLWDSRGRLPEELARAFGERVAAAASPIDDVRGSAAYRRHSLSVMARRAVTWAWNDLREAA